MHDCLTEHVTGRDFVDQLPFRLLELESALIVGLRAYGILLEGVRAKSYVPGTGALDDNPVVTSRADIDH